MKRFVVYSDTMGVMLGVHPEFGLLWSNVRPAGQPGALTFATEELAQRWLSQSEVAKEPLRLVAVDADWGGTVASVGSIMRANLPGWIDADLITINKLPA